MPCDLPRVAGGQGRLWHVGGGRQTIPANGSTEHRVTWSGRGGCTRMSISKTFVSTPSKPLRRRSRPSLLHVASDFPYTHDLTRLLRLLDRHGTKIPKYVRRVSDLTRFAVESRYPGLSGPLTRREHRTMVRIAESVVGWADRLVKRGLAP